MTSPGPHSNERAVLDAAITLSLTVAGGKVRKRLKQLKRALADVDQQRAARLAAGTEWVCGGCGYHNSGGICTHCGRTAAGTEEG